MKIRNVVHKGLRQFIEEDEAAGDMEREGELRTVPSWEAH
jgi:proteic killer suppression protein